MFKKVVFALLLILGISFAATQVTNCMNITTPGYYYMSGDITNLTVSVDGECIGAPACMQIQSDDVIFDCGYNVLTSIIPFDANNQTNITLANCTINATSGKTVAVAFCYVNSSRVENVEFSSNTYGTYLYNVRDAYLYNLTHINTGSHSIVSESDNITIINMTGLSSSSVSNTLSVQDSNNIYLRDFYNFSVRLTECINTTTENLYSPDPDEGLGWSIVTYGAPSFNHTLRGAYISDCDDGGATGCIDYSGSEYVYLEDIELVAPNAYYVLANTTHINIALTNSEVGLLIPAINNVTIDGFTATTTTQGVPGLYIANRASNISISNFAWHDYSTKPNFGVYIEGDAAAPYVPYDNLTFSNISIFNSATGVYIGDSAKSTRFDGLSITNASWRGIDLYYAGFQSGCNPTSTFNDITSDHHFTDVAINGALQGVYADDDVCEIHFNEVEINATDSGFYLFPSAGGGDWGSQYVSLDNFAIEVSSATGIGLNLSKNIDSNYTNGEISGGAYCIWTYRARDNNTYADLELHDCDTGFLLSNTVHPPAGASFVNLTRISIYDVLLDFDTSDFWYPTIFENMFFGNSSGGLGIEFLTYGCLNLTSTAQPAALPAGYTEFHGNYLEITPDLSTPSCSLPGRYAATNETGFIWSAAQESGYDMSTLKVLKWNGSAWSEVPGTLDLANRLYEVGNMSNFSIFTLTADEAAGGGGSSGSSTRDNGPITLLVPAEVNVLEPVLIQTLDKGGNPLNAKVSVKLGLQTIFYGFVGADGVLQITPAEPGTYTVSASKDNYDSPVPLEFVALLQELEAYVPDSVEENEQFDVFVTTTEGPLQGARVEIEGLVRMTSEDGATSFSIPEAGNYKVDITKEGYWPWSTTLNVRADGVEAPIIIPEGPGPVIIEPEPKEPSVAPYTPPIIQTEIPSVEQSQQPLSLEQMETQEHWLWFVLLFIIIVAGALYWIYAGKKKKHPKKKK